MTPTIARTETPVESSESPCSSHFCEVWLAAEKGIVDLCGMPRYDSFGRHSIPVMDSQRFSLDHVLRPLVEGSPSQIEVLLDRSLGGMKVLAKRFPRSYLRDDPVSFGESEPDSLDSPWTELFLALRLGYGPSRLRGVVPCRGVYQDGNGDVLLMLEWSAGGDLFELASNLGAPGPEREATASQVLCSLLEAVTMLHSKGIAHCSISAENALLRLEGAELEVALVDFAMAAHDTDLSAVMGERGKLMYRAPETLDEKAIYDARPADLFACGVVGYVLATGTYPWQSTSDDCKAFAYVRQHGVMRFFSKRTLSVGSEKVLISTLLSKQYQAVLASLLDLDPARRRVLWH